MGCYPPLLLNTALDVRFISLSLVNLLCGLIYANWSVQHMNWKLYLFILSFFNLNFSVVLQVLMLTRPVDVRICSAASGLAVDPESDALFSVFISLYPLHLSPRVPLSSLIHVHFNREIGSRCCSTQFDFPKTKNASNKVKFGIVNQSPSLQFLRGIVKELNDVYL